MTPATERDTTFDRLCRGDNGILERHCGPRSGVLTELWVQQNFIHQSKLVNKEYTYTEDLNVKNQLLNYDTT